ncbi:Formate--tetrahydrofolate ligase [compost metagenome]
MKSITEIAKNININEDHLELYGKYKAKLSTSLWEQIKHKQDGKLVLVTAMNPTPAGEGKTLTTIGLTQALNLANINSIAALREPSLGPCMGMKGGATGSGKAQIVPAEDINLHFTGDIHAITSAHNLLTAMIDNHIFQGNELNIDLQNIVWNRVMDMNDRSLRNIITHINKEVTRESSFQITTASEIMAILCLSDNLSNLQERLEKILIGYDTKQQPIFASQIGAVRAMTALLKDAIKPNLVQTLEGTPVILHGGPFANIAHGCSSVIGTRYALKLSDVVVTEAGFGADLGAEKFMNIKCRQANLNPDAVVLVVTAKSLKYNGGVSKDELKIENNEALTSGLSNMKRHIENLKKFNVPIVVAINHFEGDTDEELNLIQKACSELNIQSAISKVWALGGAGGLDLAHKLKHILDNEVSDYRPLYLNEDNFESKIKKIVTEIYRGIDVSFSLEARQMLDNLDKLGIKDLQVCMAKNPYSFSDQPKLLGAPENFIINVKEIKLSNGAGFIVVITGDVMTMPGLPKNPAAKQLYVDEHNQIQGLT